MAGFKSDETGKVEAIPQKAKRGPKPSGIKKPIAPNTTEYMYQQGVKLLSENFENGGDPAKIGRDSGTLHFIHALGQSQRPRSRRIANAKKVKSYLVVGAVFKTDIDVDVPDIPITCTVFTGVKPEQMGTKHIKAGETFILNMLEYMFLIIREEYSGCCEYEGDPEFCYFSPKVQNFLTNGPQSQKLPTPTICFKVGSPKESMVAIDVKTADGRWECLPEYQEKFGDLFLKSTPPDIETASIARAQGITASLRKMLIETDTDKDTD